MKEYVHKISKTGEEFTHKLPENWKELVEQEGKEQAFAYAIHGYRIAQNTIDRNLGKETKTAKLKKALATLKDNPELAEQMGIDLSEL